MRSKDFLSGYLCAVQFMAISHGADSIAEDSIIESGFSEKEFTEEQIEHGYCDEKMLPLIKEAFRRKALK